MHENYDKLFSGHIRFGMTENKLYLLDKPMCYKEISTEMSVCL